MSSVIDQMRRPPEGYFNVRFGLPEYTDWMDESMSWKETCYIGDWSFLAETRFTGPDAAKLLADVSVNSFANFAIGQSKHLIHTDTNGHVIHEGVLSRFGDEEYMLFGRGGFWTDYNLRHGSYDAKSEFLDWFVFQVSGPFALKLVEKLVGHSMRDVKFMHSISVKIAGHDVRALRQGMSGEIGFELQGPREHADEIYAAVLAAGEEFGIRRMGARVSGVNHLEACFPTIVVDYLPAVFEPGMEDYKAEFFAAMPGFAKTFNVAGSFDGQKISDYYRDPVELGWGRNVKFDHDFIGREALEQVMANPTRVMRTLVWNADDVTEVYRSLFSKDTPYPVMELPRDQRGFMWADQVLKDGQPAGVATSRGYSYYFREMLSLATMNVDCADIGTEVVVLWGNPSGPQIEIRATVAQAPYKQSNRRADLSQV